MKKQLKKWKNKKDKNKKKEKKGIQMKEDSIIKDGKEFLEGWKNWTLN